MKIRLLLNTVVNVEFTKSFNKLLAFDLPAKDAYALTKSGREMQNALNDYNNVRGIAFRRHGYQLLDDKQQPTGNWKLKPENEAAFRSEMNELLKQEVPIFLDHKVKLPDTAILSALDIDNLSDVVEIDLPEITPLMTEEQLMEKATVVVPMPVAQKTEEPAAMPPGLARVNAATPTQ